MAKFVNILFILLKLKLGFHFNKSYKIKLIEILLVEFTYCFVEENLKYSKYTLPVHKTPQILHEPS